MLFKRRNRESIFSKIRNFIWPKMGIKKTIIYYKYRILRMPHSTRDIAMGLASGCVVSWTPTIPFQILQCFIFCKIVRANFPASLLGTAFGNPWTFPILFIIAYNVGNLSLTLLGYNMVLEIQTDQNIFANIFETIEVILVTSLEESGNFLLGLVGITSFFQSDFPADVLEKSYEYLHKIILPTLVGGYIMAVFTYPMFYYSFFYMITAGRASRIVVSKKVHKIIDHRHEKKERKNK